MAQLRLLKDEEVFGWSEEEEKIVSVLKKCKIQGDYRGDRLEVFEKYGDQTEITDMVYLNGSAEESPGIFLKSPSIRKWQSTYTQTLNVEKFRRESIAEDNSEGIIRPVLEDDNLVSKYIKDGAPEEIQYGEYPQTAVDQEMQAKLTRALNANVLSKTNEKFTFSKNSTIEKGFIRMKDYDVYEYEGRKFIQMNVKFNTYGYTLSNGWKYSTAFEDRYMWVEVLPITWLYDKGKNIFVSKYGLVSGIDYDHLNNYLPVMYQQMTQSQTKTKEINSMFSEPKRDDFDNEIEILK